MGLLDALQDPQFRQDVRRGLLDAGNRGLVGGLLGAPVDMISAALRPLGYRHEAPVGGSEWIGQKMQGLGAVSAQRNPAAEALAGFIDPATLGAGALKALPMVAGMAARPKYWDSLVDVLKAGQAADVPFGKVAAHTEQRVNALRQVLDQPLVQRGDQWVIPQNVVQKLKTNRADTEMNAGNSLWAGRSSAIAKADESASYRSAIPEHTGNAQSMPQPGYSPQYQAALDAGLDMSYEARMKRAAEQGYEPLYHGTNSDIAAFGRVDGGNMWGRATYLTDSPQDASQYATGWHNRITPDGNAGPNVMPLMVRGRFLDMDAPVSPKDIKALSKLADVPLKDYMFTNKGRDLVQALREQTVEGPNHWLKMGRFDGLKGAGANTPAGGAGSVQAVFDPANIRSVNAAFNPANIGKADLLGRLDPALLPWLGAGALGAWAGQGLLGERP